MTAANPPPVALKLEKVYQPCMLVTKKRYVGFIYESPSQKVPSFDAKVGGHSCLVGRKGGWAPHPFLHWLASCSTLLLSPPALP